MERERKKSNIEKEVKRERKNQRAREKLERERETERAERGGRQKVIGISNNMTLLLTWL